MVARNEGALRGRSVIEAVENLDMSEPIVAAPLDAATAVRRVTLAGGRQAHLCARAHLLLNGEGVPVGALLILTPKLPPCELRGIPLDKGLLGR
jgi:hypothetical protein